jgi:hypothetical protein
VAGGRGIPDSRPVVFGEGSLLEEHLTEPIEQKDMDGSVAEIEPMDLPPGSLSDDFIAFVDHIEDFFRHAPRKRVVLPVGKGKGRVGMDRWAVPAMPSGAKERGLRWSASTATRFGNVPGEGDEFGKGRVRGKW